MEKPCALRPPGQSPIVPVLHLSHPPILTTAACVVGRRVGIADKMQPPRTFARPGEQFGIARLGAEDVPGDDMVGTAMVLDESDPELSVKTDS